MEDKKVLLSIKDLQVKFRVRGRILTAIRGISLDIYENETIAIVGESGSGKSVFTKTFAGMLDSNGFIDQGHIIFSDDELAKITVVRNDKVEALIKDATERFNASAKKEYGAATWRKMQELESEKRQKESLTEEEKDTIEKDLKNLKDDRTDLFNKKQTLDPKKEKAQIKEIAAKLKTMDAQIKVDEEKIANLEKERKAAVAADTAYMASFNSRMEALKAQYAKECDHEITEEQKKRNDILVKEMILAVNRYPERKRRKMVPQIEAAYDKAMTMGINFDNYDERDAIYDGITFPVHYVDEDAKELHGYSILDMVNVKNPADWDKIRGSRIATVFQDPMTSLNPIITIGKQITSVIMKHQDVTEAEARNRALELMRKVGIPNPAARFDDYPFQYSGGMRQRIVIAIALSCQPKILICDEPTTALDVTIQAQILQLFKDLQKEFGYTCVFITHDLGVVANVADRVAVMYAGQIVELGTVEDVFYDPKHPYTWALLSSLPQLAEKNTTMFSIAGTPPSLYNKVIGDPFAPRNEYCMKIDTILDPPMFKVSDTHYAKTWLLDPNAPKVDKPDQICNIHEKLVNVFNI